MYSAGKVFSKIARISSLAITISLLLTGCDVLGYASFFEQPNYTVLEKLPGSIEIRKYEMRTFAESQVNGTDMTARRNCFRLLLNYISGANENAEKIRMTVPVSTPQIQLKEPKIDTLATSIENNTYTMRFFLPRDFSIKSAPTPENQGVSIGQIPPQVEASLRYNGSQSDSRAKIHQERLIAALNSSEWRPTKTPSALYYNPPFSVPILRRNEITVPVERR